MKAKVNSRLTEEGEKRKIRLKIKRMLEQKWDENELQSLLKDIKLTEEEELYEWNHQKEKFR